ncbi:MAG: hypothetical protein K2L67_00705 [Clostridia bacterium]|nr:hypothetical protein [Clostridia bacterium]
MIILIVLAIAVSVFLFIRHKQKTDERLSRLHDIDYTQILKSSGGDIGSVTTYGNNGNTNYGSYHTSPTTKFLVVYLNGEREIVTVNDNSRLCQEYLLRLKTDN